MLRIILVLAASTFAAPWCVQTQYGPPRCHYFDANECKAVAYKENGICVPKPKEESNINRTTDPYMLNQGQQKGFAESFAEGAELRRRMDAHRAQQAQARQEMEIQKVTAAQNQVAFDMEVKAKAIAWREAYPDQPNPYQEYIDQQQATARRQAIEREARDEERRERHARNRETAFKLVLVGVLATAAVFATAATIEAND